MADAAVKRAEVASACAAFKAPARDNSRARASSICAKCAFAVASAVASAAARAAASAASAASCAARARDFASSSPAVASAFASVASAASARDSAARAAASARPRAETSALSCASKDACSPSRKSSLCIRLAESSSLARSAAISSASLFLCARTHTTVFLAAHARVIVCSFVAAQTASSLTAFVDALDLPPRKAACTTFAARFALARCAFLRPRRPRCAASMKTAAVLAREK
mmetsp:Transcript_39100/g.96684  ORF Transcript_39100/g.96684 Transcript_39100/m.96684 type:complete len:231 (-) Transcript_39100:2472-3164(-)